MHNQLLYCGLASPGSPEFTPQGGDPVADLGLRITMTEEATNIKNQYNPNLTIRNAKSTHIRHNKFNLTLVSCVLVLKIFLESGFNYTFIFIFIFQIVLSIMKTDNQ
jgi:hypothetical protein